jgi:hypothetical protein
MPFNGGGGGALPPHEHTNIANDGGPLDFNNTTIGSMNAGDITFSDGAALQTLAYPAVPAGETLTAAALSTAPSWAGAASGAATILVDSVTLVASNNTITSTFAAVNQSDVSQFFAILNMEKDTAGGQVNCTANSIVSASYDYGMIQQSNFAAPTGTGATARNSWDILFNNLGDKIFTKVDFLCNAYSDNIQGVATTVSQTDTSITRLYNTTAGQTSISEIEFTVSAGQMYAGSRLDVYKVEI